MNKLAIAAAAALAATTFGLSGAFAQTSEDAFTKADANKDGAVSFEEALGAYPTLTQDLFNKADANADAKLDAAEFAALVGLTANVDNATGGSSSASTSTSSSASSSQ
jgi:hypothetical protein